MRTRYDHAQVARPMFLALAVATLGTAIGLTITEEQFAFRLVLVGLAIVALLFWRLRITIDERRLRWCFGIGLIRFSEPLDNIAAAELTTIRWYEGHGIKLTRRGWLYSSGGTDVVLVHRRVGADLLLGSDDARGLARAITNALDSAASAAPRRTAV